MRIEGKSMLQMLLESVYNLKQKWNDDKFRYECKELDNWISCKDNYIWNPSTRDCECNKVACKINEYLDIKTCSCKNVYLVEILNTTATSIDDKKLTCEKNNCFIHTILLVIVFLLLLAVISISCYYYYTSDWIKMEYVLSY